MWDWGRVGGRCTAVCCFVLDVMTVPTSNETILNLHVKPSISKDKDSRAIWYPSGETEPAAAAAAVYVRRSCEQYVRSSIVPANPGSILGGRVTGQYVAFTRNPEQHVRAENVSRPAKLSISFALKKRVRTKEQKNKQKLTQLKTTWIQCRVKSSSIPLCPVF